MSDTTELSIPNSSIKDDINDEKLAELISRKPNLERLRLFGCSNITRLPVLPVTLTKLSVDQCDEITLLENLPDNLVVLDCDMLPKLEAIVSPPLLRTLVCHNCEKLSNIDISLSNDLHLLDATNCENLHNIIGNIPHSLERIIIETKSLQPETAQKLLDYYNIKDAVFHDEHRWWPRELPPIAATIQAMDDLGIERTKLFGGGKLTRKRKGSKRRKTRKQKGKRRTKIIKRKQNKSAK